jgi:hypothetical protein
MIVSMEIIVEGDMYGEHLSSQFGCKLAGV